jgi:hypothetical protein
MNILVLNCGSSTVKSQLIEDMIFQGSEVAAKAHKTVQEALDELQIRRKGLAASPIIIFFAVLAIYLKRRQIENNQTERSD